MAVVVEVPDAESSRLARRLIGRRTGVSVVVSGTRDAVHASVSTGSDNVAKILVRREGTAGPEEVISLLNDGVRAVIPADEASLHELLRSRVDSVRSGMCPLISDVTADRSDIDDFLAAMKRRTTQRTGRRVSTDDSPLSGGETRILQRISEGVTSQEIADEMGFQLQTVKNKVTTILTKTQARSRTHAVSIAQNHGWIQGSSQ